MDKKREELLFCDSILHFVWKTLRCMRHNLREAMKMDVMTGTISPIYSVLFDHSLFQCNEMHL